MKAPFFSVLIPSYNRPDFLKKSINSVLKSDFENYELIISDDNSPKIKEIESNCSDLWKDSRVFFYKQKVNLGEAGNRNWLIDKATAKWLLVLGDDDELHSDALRKLFFEISCADKGRASDLYAFGYRVVDEFSRVQRSISIPRELIISHHDRQLIKHFFYMNDFPFWYFHPATFCCKSRILREIPARTDVGIGDDYWFLLSFLIKKYTIQVIPEALFDYRKFTMLGLNKDTGAQLNQSLEKFSSVMAREKILTKLLYNCSLDDYLYAHIHSKKFVEIFLYTPMANESLMEYCQHPPVKISSCIYKLMPYSSFVEKNMKIVRLKGIALRLKGFIRVTGFKGLWLLMLRGVRKFG